MSDYPETLGDLAIGAKFEMLNYEGVYQRVQLPESYTLGMNRQLVGDTITVTPDGDGIHVPIMRPDSRVMFMGKVKPVRQVQVFKQSTGKAWRKARVDPETSVEDAVATTVQRLADMHELIVGTRPTVNANEPAHITMLRWTPLFCDYQVFVDRSALAEKRATEAKNRAESDERARFVAEARTRKAESKLKDALETFKKTLGLLT